MLDLRGLIDLACRVLGCLVIMTPQAALHNYDTLKASAEGSERELYARNMLKIIECAQSRLKDAIAATHPKRARTVEDRKREVAEERKVRLLIDSLLAEL